MLRPVARLGRHSFHCPRCRRGRCLGCGRCGCFRRPVLRCRWPCCLDRCCEAVVVVVEVVVMFLSLFVVVVVVVVWLSLSFFLLLLLLYWFDWPRCPGAKTHGFCTILRKQPRK